MFDRSIKSIEVDLHTFDLHCFVLWAFIYCSGLLKFVAEVNQTLAGVYRFLGVWLLCIISQKVWKRKCVRPNFSLFSKVWNYVSWNVKCTYCFIPKNMLSEKISKCSSLIFFKYLCELLLHNFTRKASVLKLN